MKRIALALLAAAALASAASAQEPRITASPRLVTTKDPVLLTFSGTILCSAATPVEPARIEGDRIILPVSSGNDCPLPSNILPFTQVFPVGPLPAGTWTVEGQVNGQVVTTRILNVDPADPFLQLHDGLFSVRVAWRTPDGALSGQGYGVPLSTDSGYIFFFDGANPEISVKILDGRPVNNRWWVFISTTTNLELTITVQKIVQIEPPLAETKVYVSPAGANRNFIDTDAFP